MTAIRKREYPLNSDDSIQMNWKIEVGVYQPQLPQQLLPLYTDLHELSQGQNYQTTARSSPSAGFYHLQKFTYCPIFPRTEHLKVGFAIWETGSAHAKTVFFLKKGRRFA